MRISYDYDTRVHMIRISYDTRVRKLNDTRIPVFN